MSRIASRIWLAVSMVTVPLLAADKTPPVVPQAVVAQPAFKSFTGKIRGKKVRLRCAPNLSSATIRELTSGDMLVVVGEESDFYAVLPPSGLKGYVYRTYVLDDVIEGQRVNVRVSPDLESAVLAQLNSGDPCKGVIAPQNNKWMEIDLPPFARLYVAKEYVETAGGPELFQDHQRRVREVTELLNDAYLTSQSEMRKPYTQIDIQRVEQAFAPIVNQYQDFPVQVAKAKEALKQVQDLYTQKKVTHLETKQLDSLAVSRSQRKELESQVKTQQERLAALEMEVEKTLSEAQQASKPLVKAEPAKSEPVHAEAPKAEKPVAEKPAVEKPKVEKVAATPEKPKTQKPVAKTEKVADKSTSGWTSAEEKLFQQWAAEHQPATMEAFYMEEALAAVKLAGTVEPYREPLKNRPGDYILYDNYRPLGYLYSTQVDLASLVGKKVTLQLAPRPNHHFAFPAFYVLSAEAS